MESIGRLNQGQAIAGASPAAAYAKGQEIHKALGALLWAVDAASHNRRRGDAGASEAQGKAERELAVYVEGLTS